MLIAALFIITKKNPGSNKDILSEENGKTHCAICILWNIIQQLKMSYQIKKAWMNFKWIMQSERSQSEKAVQCMI